MAIPKYIIEEIKHAVRLSEVLGGYITLRRAGKEFHALCPFHQEKTPSFTINDDKGFYHCFGCGAHGDAISFLMNHEQMNYVEAIKHLASDVGIEVPEERPEDIAQHNRVESLYEVMTKATEWFEQKLKSDDGWAAREYITKRGLKPQIVSRFRLGYAPKDRTGLKEHLLAAGVTEKQMIEVGLLTKPEDGTSYDKFRSRLMFPIFNASGHVVAFGGRLITDDPDSRAPKYLNSPETELFHKRSQFYVSPGVTGGVAKLARGSGRLLVVEGYMDVIACVQAGFEEVVATLGTAFTEEHTKMLWRAVDEPVLCLDGDSAGSRAMLRAAELAMPLLTPGKSLRFMLLPKGDDPDTLLKRQGKAAFEKLITGAVPLHEAMFNAYTTDVDMRDPTRRAGLEKRFDEITGNVTDPTVRQHLQRYFKEAIWQYGRKKYSAKGKIAAPSQVQVQSNPLEKLNQLVLKLLITYPGLLVYANAEELLMRMHTENEQMQDLATTIQAYMHEEEGQVSAEGLDAHIAQKGLADLCVQLKKDKSLLIPAVHAEDPAQSQQVITQWLDQLDRMNLENEYQKLINTIHSSEASDEALERMMVLQREIQARKTSA